MTEMNDMNDWEEKQINKAVMTKPQQLLHSTQWIKKACGVRASWGYVSNWVRVASWMEKWNCLKRIFGTMIIKNNETKAAEEFTGDATDDATKKTTVSNSCIT